MIRAKDIQNGLLHLIGWEQSFDTAILAIDESLTQSESGLYYQQAHPLLTLRNIASIAPDFDNMNIPLWNNSVGYIKGSLVKKTSENEPVVTFRAKRSNIGKNPTENPDDWKRVNLFSEWLTQKTKASIQNAIGRFCVEKSLLKQSKSLCENRTLFDGTGRISDVIPNKSNIVGFEVVPIRAKGVTTKLNKIGLQFTQPGEYTIYIMHSSMAFPVKVLKFTKVRANSIEWFALEDVYLPYESLDNDAGGSWYICYNQNELPEGSQAIRKDRDWSKGPCSACSRSEIIAWQAWSKYLEVHPFYIGSEQMRADDFNNDYNNDFSANNLLCTQSGDFSDDFSDDFAKANIRLWDVSKNMYTYDTNYGINLEVSVYCDLTDFIINQRALFQDVLLKQLAVDFLREMAFNANVRTNRHSINASKMDILYELDGDSSSMKSSGLSHQLNQAYKALSLDLRGISRACLSCHNGGVKYRVV